jgi:hypothetical protein
MQGSAPKSKDDYHQTPEKTIPEEEQRTLGRER